PSETGKAAPACPAVRVPVPLETLSLFLDGLHARDGHLDEQMDVTHYCGQVSPDLHQCALFDGRGGSAKLIGVEYVITAKAFAELPEAERALWHSHVYEVKSGLLVAPGTSEDRSLMETLANTYGKTWHTWQTHDGDALPLGRPDLMMSLTKDGQA